MKSSTKFRNVALLLVALSLLASLLALRAASGPSDRSASEDSPSGEELSVDNPSREESPGDESSGASYGLPGGALAPENRATKEDIPRLLADPVARKLFDEVRACFPDDQNGFYELFEQAPCYEDLLNAAAAEVDPAVILHVMQALVADRPDVLAACHNGGHSAVAILTKRIWDSSDPYEEQLSQMRRVMQNATDVCQNGYVHGFHDAIGEGKPNMDSFKAIGTICAELGGDEGKIDCGHGLGHSVWYATQDFKKAAEICGMFPDTLKYRCDDGVIMYVPDVWTKELQKKTGKTGWAADPRSDNWDTERYYQSTLDLCRTWPAERHDDPDPRLGCWMGIVSGLLWRPMTTLMNYGNYEDIAAEVKPLVTKSEWVCTELGGRAEETCMKEWSDLVPFVAQNIPKNIEDICSALVKYAQRCRTESLARLAENERRDTELSRYERDDGKDGE